MNRSVAYQEQPNNFTDNRQTIGGAQISTMKVFGLAPSGNGAYIGQMGIANPVPTTTNLYIWTGLEWTLISSSDTNLLPDTVVMEDQANNFTVSNQRIQDCPIVYLDDGTAPPGLIKGPGHMYVQNTVPPHVFFSPDGMEWTQLRTHDEATDYVEVTKANNFVNKDQAIDSRPIVAVVQNALDPVKAGVNPTRQGELYIQIPDGTTDGKARMWISNADGGLHWDALTHMDLPGTLARTDKDNDFQTLGQKISGKQIISFVDGGDVDPGISGLPADYDGQFYLAVRDMAGGEKSVGIWVAKGNQWLPIIEDSKSSTIVRTDKSNVFLNPNQFIGTGPDARMIAGSRVKRGSLSPVADSLWRARNEGEITIHINDGTVPVQYSIWVSVSVNPSTTTNAGEWAMIWSSVNGPIQYYARTDQSNVFAPMQYINDGSDNHLITVAREGGPLSPKGRTIPLSSGEYYTQTINGGTKHHMWMSSAAADTDSWQRIYTSEDEEVVRTDVTNTFMTNEQFLHFTSTKKDRIMGSRPAKIIGPDTITGPAYNAIEPSMFGEVVVCEEWDKDFPSDKTKIKIRAYLAVGKGRKSWLMIGEDLKSNLELLGDDSNN